MRTIDAVPVAVRGLDEHPLRAYLSDDSTDVTAQFMGDGEFTIGVAKEADVADAEDLTGCPLF